MKKVIELIRVSTEAQAENDRASIPAQRAINRRTVQAYGLEIAHSIEIADVSGAAVLLAPEMQQLLKLIQSPEIHGVVAREFSRLMRPENFSDYALLQAFVDSKTILYLPEGPIDFNSKTGRLMGAIRAAIAGLERSELLERSWTAKEERRRAGACPSGHITWPYGVGFSKEAGWHYKPEAEKVREAFRLFLSGVTCYSELSRKSGIPRSALPIILRNPIYTGWRVYDQRRDMSPGALRVKNDGRQGDRRKALRAPDEIIRVQVIEEPLISQAEFNRAQKMVEAKRARGSRARVETRRKFTYGGFLRCAACQLLIYSQSSHRGKLFDYYVCKGRQYLHTCQTLYMRREKLEEKLDFLLAVRLTDNGFLQEIVSEQERRRNQGGSQARMARLQAQITGLREKQQRVLDAYFEGVINVDDRNRRLEAVERDLKLAQAALLREAPTPQVTAEELSQLFQPFSDWRLLALEDKRRILAAVVPEIHVADYTVKAICMILPHGGKVVRPVGFSRLESRRRRACWRSGRSGTARFSCALRGQKACLRDPQFRSCLRSAAVRCARE
jgi:DNA invertase Pin-like site-specific DNA recombinase